MLLLGLGLGLVMVLVLAAQNAVDYRLLGVATSGATLFRQVGGSIGAAFGAIFTNELGRELASRLPAGAHAPAHASPGAIQHLPRSMRSTSRPSPPRFIPVFLTATAVMVVAFGLSWRLRDVPLRETSGSDAPDRDVPADAYVGGASRGGSRTRAVAAAAGAPATLRQ